MAFFSDFQYGVRSSQLTVDILTVVYNRIAWSFLRSAATQPTALDRSKAFERVQHAGLLHKFKSYAISSRFFYFIFSH